MLINQSVFKNTIGPTLGHESLVSMVAFYGTH